jgi:hypothetical protein
MSPPQSCRRAAELLSQSLDEPLDLAARSQLRLHLFLCRSCRHVENQFAGIRDLASNLFGGALDEDPGERPPAAPEASD